MTKQETVKYFGIVAIGGIIIYAVWKYIQNRNALIVANQTPQQSAGSTDTASAPLPVPPVQQFTVPAINLFEASPTTNTPNPSASGVPNYVDQTDGYKTGPTSPPPSQIPTFYYPVQQALNSVASALGALPGTTATTPKDSTGCGCGGSSEVCATSCDITNSRFTDGRGGCLAFDRNAQINDANINWQKYGDNLAHAVTDPNFIVASQYSPTQEWSNTSAYIEQRGFWHGGYWDGQWGVAGEGF